jgi:aminopeptidase N
MKKHILLLTLSFLYTAVLFSQPSADRYDKGFYRYELQRARARYLHSAQENLASSSIDAKYYRLNLRITTSPQYLYGTMTMNALSTVDNISSVTLDLMNSLTVDSVKVDGVKTGSVQQTSTVTITLDRAYNAGEMIHLQVFYRGVPGSSGFGSFEFSSHNSVPWVWTLSEPYGAKDWWPCNDHPSDKADSADILVTCDSSYKVGSNGKLLSVINNHNGTSTHHWQTHYPISTYLICIAITNYAQFSNWFHYSSSDSMEVLNYVLPEHLASAQAGLPNAVTGLQIFSDLFGLYPFINEKFGHAEFGWGGGMEHQTMTYLTGFGEWLVIHELAHEWFGDMITCRTWPDLWLNEGFATYLEVLYNEKKYGTASYWGEMPGIMSYAKNATGSVYLQDTSSVGYMFDGARVYDKGAAVLHMLRHVLGDTVFFHSMYDYANDPELKYGTAITRDFQHVCETTSGVDLNYFFDEWIFGEKFPQYKYGWTIDSTMGGFSVIIGVNQTTGTSNPAFFTMPIDFKISASGWDTTVVLLNNQVSQTFIVNVSHRPLSVSLDPEGWIMKSADSLKSFTASRTSIDVGSCTINSTKTDSVIIYNTGLTQLDITNVYSDSAELTVVPVSATIAPSASQKFYITFQPITVGSKSSHIVFVHTGATSPDQISITGSAVYPSIQVTAGWNLLSVPFALSAHRLIDVFPTAFSAAYSYDDGQGYKPRSDSIYNGIGYWIKFAHSDTVFFSGDTLFTYRDTVNTGWNMIGTIACVIPASSIVTNPPSIITSAYFDYNRGYHVADSLVPGRGYWIKVNGPGTLTLNAVGSLKQISKTGSSVSSLSRIAFNDKNGGEQILYIASPEMNLLLEHFEMPPPAPEGGLDVRYLSGRNCEIIGDGSNVEYPIVVSSESFPVTIMWEAVPNVPNAALRIGNRIYPLSSPGNAIVPSQESEIVLCQQQSPSEPVKFTLEQNIPNPFNPSTIIRYSLPSDTKVTLTIYDITGRIVRNLVDAFQNAGEKSVEFDANNLPTGVYYYLLRTDHGVRSNKMILLR